VEGKESFLNFYCQKMTIWQLNLQKSPYNQYFKQLVSFLGRAKSALCYLKVESQLKDHLCLSRGKKWQNSRLKRVFRCIFVVFCYFRLLVFVNIEDLLTVLLVWKNIEPLEWPSSNRRMILMFHYKEGVYSTWSLY
jgi:hypothetical protein